MEELRKGFHHKLDELRDDTARLAAMAIEAIPRATEVLLSGDLDGANALINRDDEIDALAIEIEEQCYQQIALQAPVASDLRQLVSMVKIVADIERSADLTVNICKAARRIYGHELDPRLRGLIAKMGEQAQQLFSAALESFQEGNESKAAALDDMDTYLDSLQRQFIQAILEVHAQGNLDLQVAIQLAVVARFYERIGDHSVNIGEKVRFVVSGWLPELKGAQRFVQQRDLSGPIPIVQPPQS